MVAGFIDKVLQAVDSGVSEAFHPLQLQAPTPIYHSIKLFHLVEAVLFAMEAWKVSAPNVPAILIAGACIDVQAAVFLEGSPGFSEEIREREMVDGVEGGDEVQREILERQASAATIYGLEFIDVSLSKVQAQLLQHFAVGIYAVKVELGAHTLVELQRISARTASHIRGPNLGVWIELLSNILYRARVGYPEVLVPARYR
jgi:hypothetical protein